MNAAAEATRAIVVEFDLSGGFGWGDGGVNLADVTKGSTGWTVAGGAGGCVFGEVRSLPRGGVLSGTLPGGSMLVGTFLAVIVFAATGLGGSCVGKTELGGTSTGGTSIGGTLLIGVWLLSALEGCGTLGRGT